MCNSCSFSPVSEHQQFHSHLTALRTEIMEYDNKIIKFAQQLGDIEEQLWEKGKQLEETTTSKKLENKTASINVNCVCVALLADPKT